MNVEQATAQLARAAQRGSPDAFQNSGPRANRVVPGNGELGVGFRRIRSTMTDHRKVLGLLVLIVALLPSRGGLRLG